jgi:hypothetical protein
MTFKSVNEGLHKVIDVASWLYQRLMDGARHFIKRIANLVS